MFRGTFYAAYGKDLHADWMKSRYPGAEATGSGWIQDYRLLFQGNLWKETVNLIPQSGFRVPVGIWYLPFCKMMQDDIQNHLCMETMIMELGEGQFPIIVYTRKRKEKRQVPSMRLYQSMLSGYQEFGLPVKELDEAAFRCCSSGWERRWRRRVYQFCSNEEVVRLPLQIQGVIIRKVRCSMPEQTALKNDSVGRTY